MDDIWKQLSDAHTEVINDFKQKWKHVSRGPSTIESFKAFYHAVNWTEPWILAILSFHLILFLLVLSQRRNFAAQGFIFFLSMIAIYSSEYINTFLMHHWTLFSQQNYFTTDGQFISAVWSAPLLFIMFVVLMNYLIASAGLMVTMKRKELIYKARLAANKETKQEKETKGSSTSTKKDT